MSKDFIVRNVPDEIYGQLKKISSTYGYPSFNQFMLSQCQTIVANDGLNYYQNKFAKELTEIKDQQKILVESLVKEDVTEAAILANLDITEELISDWLVFMDDVGAMDAERKAGGVI
ncbi:hypothetical protein [Streptococcus sobrinus]|uniref:hypothetical protein n=1 Tax=Streptococcus sobrinus TaxID=1310 RepID=UPI0002DBC4D9|nr:hypothetical protein [Streptococcus sobrinus]